MRWRWLGVALTAVVCGAGVALAQTPDPVSTLPGLLREGRFSDAVRGADQALQHSPRSADAWFYRGIAENGLGNEAKSLSNLERALALDPGMVQAAEAGAQIAYRHHDPRERSFLQQVVKLEPTNTTAHAMLGVLALESGNCSAALKEFAEAGNLAASDSATTSRIALCKAQISADAGHLAEAESTLAARHQAAPEDAAVTRALAEVLLQEGRPQKAVDLLAPLQPTLSWSALNLLANAYAQQGNLALAIESYRQSIARAPMQQDSYLDLATLSMEHQSPEVALSVLDSGLQSNPQAARLLVMRGTVYAQVGKNDLAQKDFEQADRLQPSSTYGALGMGVLLREDGNLDEAQTVLEKKLQTTPKNALLSFMLADVLVRKGASPGDASFTRANDLLHVALRAQPDLAPAHALLGKLLLKDGRPEQAIAELETALRLLPSDRTAMNQLVAAYRRAGRMADAARVSGTLEQSVAAERAHDNEKNRIHLSLSGGASTSPGGTNPGSTIPGSTSPGSSAPATTTPDKP